MTANCLFCEAELAEGARFCTQCGNKVPLKKSTGKTADKKTPANKSKENRDQESKTETTVANLFKDIAVFCSNKQLAKIDGALGDVGYQEIEDQVREVFVMPANIHLRKLLLKKYPQQVKKYLEKGADLPESSRVMLRSIY